ncbi:hypothetical protein JOF41_006072 [Saccharothrix coeruleofusca]|uniref:hypothetical protein n=1 Tax=Saccharothrix coeruleofusca TaxID=33919 RepID=UPI001AE99761|nr:hypothetical protein [Saccharothrix coeruleofusca]MBP2339894.1 hypothetical protein [Saccharothrix coeruleofusca]
MRTRWARVAGAAAAVLSVGGLSIGGAGSAAAAEPVVVGSCATTVQGAPGTPISLSPAAVVDPVVHAVRAVPLLGPPLADPLRATFTALPPIPVGAVPTGSGVITGGQIAERVNAELAELPLLGPVIGALTSGVHAELSKLCGITAQAVNTAAGTVQEGSKALADASQRATGQLPGVPGGQPAPGTPPAAEQPGGTPPGTPAASPPGPATGTVAPVGGVGPLELPLYGTTGQGSGVNSGRLPLFSYGSLPFAMPGQYSPSPGVRYGGQVPGYTPGSGLPGEADGVRTAGRAQALPGSGAGGVAAPVLLAVLLLACVTGALVRTWVLRRATA